MLSTSPLQASQRKPLVGDSSSCDETVGVSAESNIAFLLQMADRFEEEGNVTEAVKSAETALLARKSLREGAGATASSFTEPLHKQALNLIQKCNGLAVSEFQNGRFDTALFLLNKALFLTSAAADTNCFGIHEHDRLRLRAASLNNLGCLEKRRENLKDALDYLHSAVEIETLVDPDVGASPSTCLNLCTLFNKVGRHEDAISAAERAIRALHFQAHQNFENVPQFMNMLMVAYFNLGVSVECANVQGWLLKALDAYTRVLEINSEHGENVSNGTVDAASDAVRRLRQLQNNYPSTLPPTLPSTSTPPSLPPIARGVSASFSGLQLQPPSAHLKALVPLSSSGTASTAGVGLRKQFESPTMRPTPSTGLPLSISQRGTPSSINVPTQLAVSGLEKHRVSKPGLPSSATSILLESAAHLGDASVKHAARMQAKIKKKEEATERAALALVKAQRSHQRDKIAQQRKEEEIEAKRRDDMAETLYAKMVESMRTEEVRRAQQAACMITAIWRGYITRRYMEILTLCTIRIQAMVRSALCRIHLRRQREEEKRQEVNAQIHARRTRAAVVIQTYARRFLRRLAIVRRYKARKLRFHHSAKRIQDAFRSYCKRRDEAIFLRMEVERREKELEADRLHTAACKIQGMYRAFKSRRFARLVRNEQLRRVSAATLIQAQIRGCLTRQWFKHYRLYRREQEMNSAASVRCITKIQRAWRMRLAKNKLAALKSQHLLRQRELRLNRSAVVIQCAFRSYLARCTAKPLRERKHLEIGSATTIQRFFRGFKARQLYANYIENQRRQDAAHCIQLWMKRVLKNKKERKLRRENIQKKLAEREALKRTAAAMCIQTYCHSALTRKYFMKLAVEYIRKAQHAILLQSVGRMYLVKKDMLALQRISHLVSMHEKRSSEMISAALVVQRKVRSYQAKCALEAKRNAKSASITIQSAWRMYKAKVHCDDLRAAFRMEQATRAILCIQRVGRSYLKQLELKRLEDYYMAQHRASLAKARREEAATQIQALWKGFATRNAINEARLRLKHTALEIMRIQRAWRAYRFRRDINAFIQYKVSERKVRTAAATRIQSFWRGVLAREYVSLVREKRFYQTVCAITIQCSWRRYLARQELARRKESRLQHQRFLALQHEGWVQAVIVVTMHIRTYLAQQNRLAIFEKRLRDRLNHRERAKKARLNMAATKIQAHYRGYCERMYARGLQRERRELEERALIVANRREKAAATIQRAVRCMFARIAANRKRVLRRIEQEKALEEQVVMADPKNIVKQLFWQHEALLKKNLVRTQLKRHNRLFNAAAKIQSLVRMFLARVAYTKELQRRERLRAHALYERMLSAKQAADAELKFTQETAAAIRIQTIVRAFLVRKMIKQRSALNSHSHEDEEQMDIAAIKIQSVWRGYSARLLAGRLAQEKNDQKDAIMYFEAARMIQKFYRGHMVRKRLGTTGTVVRRMSLRVRPQNTPRPPSVPRPSNTRSQ